MNSQKNKDSRNFKKAESKILRDIPLGKSLILSLSNEQLRKLREVAIWNVRRERLEELNPFLCPKSKKLTKAETTRKGLKGERLDYHPHIQPMKEKSIKPKRVWVPIFEGGAPGLVQQNLRRKF